MFFLFFLIAGAVWVSSNLLNFCCHVSKTVCAQMDKIHKPMSKPAVKAIIRHDACKGCAKRALPDPTEPTSRIVGGVPVTDPDKYPFFTALLYHDGVDWFWAGCGASYVGTFQGRNFVATAAHCIPFVAGNTVVSTEYRPTHVYIKPPLNWPAVALEFDKIFPVNSIHCKQGYDPAVVESANDLAVLHIASVAFDGVTNINPSNAIALATTSPAEGTPVVAIGNGTTSFGVSELNPLMEVTVQVFSNATANQVDWYGGLVQASMIAAGEAAGGKDACSGDSGGPLLWFDGGEWKLLGVTSWGAGCGLAQKPGVYTRIPSFMDFFADYMNPSVFSAFAAGIDTFTSASLSGGAGYAQTRFFTGEGFASVSRPTNTQRTIALGVGAAASLFAGNLNITVPSTGDGVSVLVEGNSPLDPVADFSGFPTGLGLQTQPADWTARFAATVTIVSGGTTYTATNQTTNPVPWTAFSPAFATAALRSSVTSIAVKLSGGDNSTTDVFGIGADPHVLCMDGTRLDIYAPGFYRYYDNGDGLIANLEVRNHPDGRDFAHALWVTEHGHHRGIVDEGGETFTFKGDVFNSKVNGQHERVVHTVHDPITGADMDFTLEGAYNTVGVRTKNLPMVVRAGGLVGGMLQRVSSLTSCESVGTLHMPAFLRSLRAHALVCGSGNPHAVSFHGASVQVGGGSDVELLAFRDTETSVDVRVTASFTADDRLTELHVFEGVESREMLTALWDPDTVAQQHASFVQVAGQGLHGVEREERGAEGIAEGSVGPLFVRVQPGGVASFAITNFEKNLRDATGMLATPLDGVSSSTGSKSMYAEMMEPHLLTGQ